MLTAMPTEGVLDVQAVGAGKGDLSASADEAGPLSIFHLFYVRQSRWSGQRREE
jgi:hypothetical protein